MAVSDLVVQTWLKENPNATAAQIAEAAIQAGVSAEQLSRVSKVPVGEINAAASSLGVKLPEAVTDTALKNWIDSNAGATTGQLYTAALNQGVGLDQIQRVSGLSTRDLLASQLLSSSDSSKWTGEGWGSAEKNALDMAKILEGIGITDVSQFGQFEKTVNKQQTVKPEYEYVNTGGDNGYNKPTGKYYIPQYGSEGEMIGKTYVDPASVTSKYEFYGDAGETVYTVNVPTTETVYGNKVTGQAVPNTYSERQTGNAWGGTFAGSGNTGYRVQFDAAGNPVFYTTGASSSDLGSIAPLLAIGGMIAAPWLSGQIGALTGLTGAGLSAATGATLGGAGSLLTGGDLGDIAKGALLGGAGGYIGGSISEGLSGNDFAGTGSNLNMAQIESGLGAPGYGYNAGAASSGLFDPAMIGSGAYTQTSYPYDYADFAAADTLQLYGQVGANPAAIEQNLVASGVDPLVAADAANQVILNPGITQADLTNYLNTQYTGTGGIYDVNPAVTYPTSTLPGSGGLLKDVPGYVEPTTTTPKTPTTTTPSTSDLLKLATTLGTLNAAGNIGGGGGGAPVNPTQGVPVNNPAYYQAIQQYYNTYMPNQPADVATPLQQWYSGAYKA